MSDDQTVKVILPPAAPSNGMPPGYVWAGSGYLLCSPEANAARLAQIADLRARLYGGVNAVSDRGRSVTYRDDAGLVSAINGLNAELAFCTTGAWPRAGLRSFHIPQVKGIF